MQAIHMRWLVVGLLFGALTSCDDTPTAFERTNPSDPKSAVFVPNPPAAFSITTEDNVAILSWNDQTSFEDGYLIEKAIGTPGTFEKQAELPPNTTVYRDESGVFGIETRYRVSAFKRVEGAFNISAVQQATLDLGGLSSVQVRLEGQRVRLDWQDGSHFERGFLVEIAQEGSDVYSEIAVLAPNSTAFVDETTAFTFAHNLVYRVSVFLEYEGVRVILGSATLPFDVKQAFSPRALTMHFRDEETVELIWEDRSGFETGFIVERSVDNDPFEEVVRLEADTEAYTDALVLADRARYAYRVQADDGQATSAYAEAGPVFFSISKPALQHVQDRANLSISLTWTHDEPLARGYVLQRATFTPKSNELIYENLATLAPETRAYHDTDVEPTVAYRYRLRTLASGYSNTLLIAYLQRYLGSSVRSIGNHTQPVEAVAFSPDGRLMATGALDLSTRNVDPFCDIFDMETGALVQRLEGAVDNVTFSPDGTLLGTATDRVGISVWDWQTGQRLYQFQEADDDITFSPDGALVAGGDQWGRIWIWRLDTGEVVKEFDSYEGFGTPRTVEFSPDGRLIATNSSSGRSKGRLFDVATGEVVQRFGTFNTGYGATFSPDGTLILATTGRNSREDGSSCLYRLEPFEYLGCFTGRDPAFRSDGKTFVTKTGFYVRVWDSETRMPVGISRQAGILTSLATWPGSDRIATGSHTGRVWFWEPGSTPPYWQVMP